MTNNNCDCGQEDLEPDSEIFWNKGSSFWMVEAAKSIECFNKGHFYIVKEAFTDEETATCYLKERYGGEVIGPGGITKLIEPINS